MSVALLLFDENVAEREEHRAQRIEARIHSRQVGNFHFMIFGRAWMVGDAGLLLKALFQNPHGKSPCSIIFITIAARDATPSFMKIFRRWVPTVHTLICNDAATLCSKSLSRSSGRFHVHAEKGEHLRTVIHFVRDQVQITIVVQVDRSRGTTAQAWHIG